MYQIKTIGRASEILEYPDEELFQLGNILIRPSRGARHVMVFFNGAVRRDLLDKTPIFQRWTWHKNFSATLFFVSDPGVSAESGIRIGWYAGTRNAPVLPEVFETIREVVELLHGHQPPITAFGSSAGGFASIMSAIQGHVDRALVINPQTNIMNYHVAHRDAFLRYFGIHNKELSDADRMRISAGFSGKNTSSGKNVRVHIYQNYSDEFHFRRHFIPFMKIAGNEQFMRGSNFYFELFDDPILKHSPPPLDRTIAWIASVAPELIEAS